MKKSVIPILLGLLVLGACSDRLGLTDSTISPGWDDTSLSHGMMELGSQLDDPYSVKNITKALASLYPTKAGLAQLNPTNLYVRFLPLSEEDYYQLEQTGVDLFDHPLDFEIVKDGDWYHDPGIPEDDITWQYAVVSTDYVAPEDIRYEVLDHVYIPENDLTKADGIDWEAVEEEAFRITGNGDMLASVTKGAKKHKPSGTVTIIDSERPGDGPIGVKGVKVSCNVFVRVDNAYTDADGVYKMDKSFSSNPHFRLIFRNRKGFSIGFNMVLTNASTSTLGTHSPKGVDVQITQNSDRMLFARCVVNNTAFEYYEDCNSRGSTMACPPSNTRIWIFPHIEASSAVMMQQGATLKGTFFEDLLGEYRILVQLFAPDITLGISGKETYGEIAREAVHELAHASHFQQVGLSYWNSYVEFILKTFISSGGVTYGAGNEEGHGFCEVGEMWAYYYENRWWQERYPNIQFEAASSYWFRPVIFMELDKLGIDRYMLFSALTAEVSSRDALKRRLIDLYPSFKGEINRLFTLYN